MASTISISIDQLTFNVFLDLKEMPAGRPCYGLGWDRFLPILTMSTGLRGTARVNPPGIIQDGDMISFSCAHRNISLQVEDDGIQRRICLRKSSALERRYCRVGSQREVTVVCTSAASMKPKAAQILTS